MWASRASLEMWGELDFGGGNRLCDAAVWGHYIYSYVNFTDVVNIAFF